MLMAKVIHARTNILHTDQTGESYSGMKRPGNSLEDVYFILEYV